MPECHSVELPILDVSQPLEPSALASLAEACKKWGFFRITNHGMSKELYSKLYSLSQQFFNLPSETKLELGPSSSINTYTPHFIASPFFECLRVFGPNFFASAQSSANTLFGQQSFAFSEALQEYGKFKNCHGYLRIVNYTPPKSLVDEVEGLGMHTDLSCVTIVYQDEVGGLQVKSKEGKWMDISPCEQTLVVNIGDMLQAWSNEKLRSSEHRIILKKPVNRLSLAFFWCFEDEKVILAPSEVVGEGDVRIYEPFVCLDYLKFREVSDRGKFEKVGFTVKDFARISL
uniref:Fe2OG dioxygenase domain-containing protein n=1 Tax=Salix viminalis TaxID=40686 RepID=A0A6N2MH11_SALVM